MLQTTAHRALPQERIAVSTQSRTGGAFVSRATLRTDRRGRFSYRVPAGASRTLRFGFDGTELLRAASSQLRVAVPAHSSIRVSRRRVRAGGTVRFSGRIAGPLPGGPVVVVPEAFFRGGWHPVGRSTTADAQGRWKMPYSFLPQTHGGFSFRVEIPHQVGYRYADGHSATISVRVVL